LKSHLKPKKEVVPDLYRVITKKTPQLISLLFEIRFQQAIHQIKGFKKYYKLVAVSNSTLQGSRVILFF
jgi:hypothetical protein